AFGLLGWWIAQEEHALRTQEEENQARERASADRTRRVLYFAQMRQAQEALEQADQDRARHLLHDWLPGPDGTDLRGWEWYFLNDRAQGRFALQGHDERANVVVFSPDGKRLASAGGPAGRPGTIKIWNPATGDLLLTLSGHAKPIKGLVFSPDGKYL